MTIRRKRKYVLAAGVVVAALLVILAVRRSGSGPGTSSPRTLTVAAAADLRFALEELVSRFEDLHPDIEVNVAYGSSGDFFAKLSSRAPFDVFLSADVIYPQRLAQEGLTLAGSEFRYAAGRIVIWVPRSSSLEVEKLGIKALLDPSVRKIAIPNPHHAPYGKAAEAAMKSLGIYEAVKDRLVLGENVAQTVQFVQSGAADVGIIARSLALAPSLQEGGRCGEIPLDAYPRIEQAGVILKWARDPGAAWRLKEFVTGPRGQEILRRYGFLPPGE
jgi:molybdate transport system substrate-binding protein